MSLRVWLPLTKDLRQQGLSDVTVTNNGATYSSTGGKLGGCYIFDGVDDAITVGNLSTLVTDNFSFACWFYHDDTWSSKNYETIFGGPSGFELETKSGSTNSPVIRAYSWGQGTFTYELNKWNHLVMTRTTSETKFYLNGELKLTGTAGTIPSGNYFVGSWSSTTGQNFKGKVNDVRIYDHCLSPMEVKELAKGLVLHYPLDRQGFGQENLLKNTGNLSLWNKEANITAIWDATEQMYKVVDSSHTSSRWGIYYDFTVTPNTTYTFTVDGKKADTTAYMGIQTFESSRTWPANRIALTTTRQRLSYTITSGANDTVGRIYLCVYPTADNTKTAYFALPKLEIGSVATPWCPHIEDANNMGLNSTTEYDCSGFCNNGEKIGTLTYTSDTPKYAVSTHIGSTSSKIHISNFPTSGFGNSYSFAWWGKRSSNSPMFWGFSDGIRLNGMYAGTLWNTGDSSSNPIYIPGTTTTITAPSVNVWHHYVMTGDGTTCKLYVNGVLYGQAKTYKAISGTSIYINGWDSGTSYCSDNTDISDFRIYATVLSASDVKSLYQNCATIDPDGTIRGQIRS